MKKAFGLLVVFATVLSVQYVLLSGSVSRSAPASTPSEEASTTSSCECCPSSLVLGSPCSTLSETTAPLHPPEETNALQSYKAFALPDGSCAHPKPDIQSFGVGAVPRRCSSTCHRCWFGRCYCVPGFAGHNCTPAGSGMPPPCSKQDDRCLLHPEQGTLQVCRHRWDSSQSLEQETWAKRNSDSDRNDGHMEAFQNYRLVPRFVGDYAELGCGPYTQSKSMFSARNIKARTITLVDPNVQFYSRHTANCAYADGLFLGQNVVLAPLGGEELVFKEQFDTVTMINVIEHVLNGYLVFQNMLRAVRHGGMLVFHDRTWDAFSGRPIEPRNFNLHPVRVRKLFMFYMMSLLDTVFEVDERDSAELQHWKKLIQCDGIYFIGYRLTLHELQLQQAGLHSVYLAMGSPTPEAIDDPAHPSVLASTEPFLFHNRGILNSFVRSTSIAAQQNLLPQISLCPIGTSDAKIESFVHGVATSKAVGGSGASLVNQTQAGRPWCHIVLGDAADPEFWTELREIAAQGITRGAASGVIVSGPVSWSRSPLRQSGLTYPVAPVHYRFPADVIIRGLSYKASAQQTAAAAAKAHGLSFVAHRRSLRPGDSRDGLWSEAVWRRYTVVMLSHSKKRLPSSRRIIKFYLSDPGCHRFLLLWNSQQIDAPSTSDLLFDGALQPERLRVLSQPANSLNNRFSPNLPIDTEAVIIQDDDCMLPSVSALSCLYATWYKSPWTVVGVQSRRISASAPYYSNNRPLNMALPRVMMFHRQWTVEYFSDTWVKMRELVDNHEGHCDDIFFATMVSARHYFGSGDSKGQFDMKRPELHANWIISSELHDLDDYDRGLAAQSSRQQLREECTREILRHFGLQELPAVEVSECSAFE